ncbi:Stress response protein SCP2 [Planktothrix tepida]|uniref:Tellurium resistance protein TerX n=2 Tax=Planktothrix TaxID=54304 RepID=A0A1J1LL44_9CYAN|nr:MULTISPECIES: TerD family protein [Planktothrix]CAD5939708.1 Stress response protein SCP2 [Planktothrix tepida]CAD5971869.1 Stress response protein SCP2 [Planktothrix pseudagardhii]CUR33199.1 Tellurium resistance protein TerX [Planktothrix tepida PCC 9214]
MAINLKKGQSIILDKNEYDLSRVVMGLGWDVAKKGLFAGLLGGNADFDLDGFALLLNAQGKLKNQQEDVIYFGHLATKNNTVIHSGDNLTGKGSGDDERIIIELKTLPAAYQRIILGVNIYHAEDRKQHFGMVNNAFVRSIDATGKEIARYSLSGETTYSGQISMLLGELSQQNGQWKFQALGTPLNLTLNGVVRSFM